MVSLMFDNRLKFFFTKFVWLLNHFYNYCSVKRWGKKDTIIDENKDYGEVETVHGKTNVKCF